jgi:multicomponent Na+:H+ antiporter subunit F
MNIFFIVIMLVLVLAGVLATIRFVKGPTAADRVMAMDNLSIIITSALVFVGYFFQRYIYIDVSLIYAVLGFIGVLTIARYLEGGI